MSSDLPGCHTLKFDNADSIPEDDSNGFGAIRGDHRKKRRNRTTQSCLSCHQNKRKCDRKRPCQRCTQLGLTGLCVYEIDDPERADPNLPETTRLRNRIAELEGVIRELKKKPQPRWVTTLQQSGERASTNGSAQGTATDLWHTRSLRSAARKRKPGEGDSDGWERDAAAGPDGVIVVKEEDEFPGTGSVHDFAQSGDFRYPVIDPASFHQHGVDGAGPRFVTPPFVSSQSSLSLALSGGPHGIDTSPRSSFSSESSGPCTPPASDSPALTYSASSSPPSLRVSTQNLSHSHAPPCRCQGNPLRWDALGSLTQNLRLTADIIQSLPEHAAQPGSLTHSCEILAWISDLEQKLVRSAAAASSSVAEATPMSPPSSLYSAPASSVPSSVLQTPQTSLQFWDACAAAAAGYPTDYPPYFTTTGQENMVGVELHGEVVV